MKQVKILLDPGHGGSETGALYGNILEKEINLKTALKLKSLLEKDNYIVILSRYEDRELTLKDRVEFTNRVMPDIFISIHHNSSYEDFGNRIEVYYRWEDDGPSLKFAEVLTMFLEKYLKIPSIKPFPAFYTVLRNNAPISVLVESYYIKYYSDELYENTVKAIHEAIKEFIKISYPKINNFEIRNNVLTLDIEGMWDAQKSSAYIDNERIIIQKRENKAYVYLTRSGNLRLNLRNYQGYPSHTFELKINNIVRSYAIDVFPGYKNMPNLINVVFYDIFLERISDNLEIEISVNGKKYSLATKDGKTSFVYEEPCEVYDIEIKISNQVFKEKIQLNDGFLFWAKLEGVDEGYGISEDRVYRIFNEYIFSSRPKLKIIAKGYQPMDIDLSEQKFFKLNKLYDGIFYKKRILILYEYFDEVHEIATRLWFFGAEVYIFRFEQELLAIKKSVEFNNDILIFFKYTNQKESIKFYEMDKNGKKLSEKLSNRLNIPVFNSSYQILIQPFGARVLLELNSLNEERYSHIIEAIKEYFLDK
ncbi:MAG: N-acetylmuramoyl-L-alanine amidase [candidate division WOR-3 bacterium]|nr:N-acetylmuramoyl-L-alanine amidase [candidate division WOR-3 bacterium]MCX7948030.1 N-acetylmuramoyl-L-alanine amidase [candidate division WOR-3 bacterium]MDW8151073.1 N-acetylmuramoyl-L-alanine amidase [candidate division WOR-3 bacterium]